MAYRAVIFDLGGVVVGSPLEAIAAYERRHAIPAGFINRVVVATGQAGAWSQLERGELTLEEFYPAFERDCEAAGRRIAARALMELVAAATVPRPAMLEAIRRIRAHGLLAAALTNNWITEDAGTGVLRPHFDVFIESAAIGLKQSIIASAVRIACSAGRSIGTGSLKNTITASPAKRSSVPWCSSTSLPSEA